MKEKLDSRTLGSVSASLIYKLIEQGKEIFTLDDACKIYGSGQRRETAYFLSSLVNRGVLARIKSGSFLILKMAQENTQLSNWPVIARILVGKGEYYISYYSAMRLHGMTTHPLTDITITIPKRQRTKKINSLSYLFIYCKPVNMWGSTEFWVTKQEKVWVSDLERTILDGFGRPDLCGGIKEVVRGIWVKQKQIDWQKLVYYSKKYQTRAAVKRLGFILETLSLGVGYLTLLENHIKKNKDYVLLEPNETKHGKYLSRWKIQLNMNIEELQKGVWE